MTAILKTAPCVFVMHGTYRIMVPVQKACVMWVRVGDTCFYDHSNGILRSACAIHTMTVPCALLDGAGKYTICCREIIERKTAYSETGEIVEETFSFRPVSGDKVVTYQIADAHHMVDAPVTAARAFEAENGALDFLILNGDLTNNSEKTENFETIYEIAGRITGGHIPVVFSRGNHDTRGVCAELLADATPTEDGKPYYTFRLGNIWGLVLDCGEDKEDTRPEYGNTVCFRAFRETETAFLEKLIQNSAEEYEAADVEHRIVIVHTPFTRKNEPPFNIEEELYTYWARLLKEHIKPEIMICGHKHTLSFGLPGSAHDDFGQPCPVAVGSLPDVKTGYFVGSGFVFEKNEIRVIFNDKDTVLETHSIART